MPVSFSSTDHVYQFCRFFTRIMHYVEMSRLLVSIRILDETCPFKFLLTSIMTQILRMNVFCLGTGRSSQHRTTVHKVGACSFIRTQEVICGGKAKRVVRLITFTTIDTSQDVFLVCNKQLQLFCY